MGFRTDLAAAAAASAATDQPRPTNSDESTPAAEPSSARDISQSTPSQEEILPVMAEQTQPPSASSPSEAIKLSLSSEIYKELDQIPHLLESLNLRTPQIVVTGNESHGKSIMINRIAGLLILPSKRELCTRCVIRIQMRRCKKDEASMAEISVQPRFLEHTTKVHHRPFTVVELDNLRAEVERHMLELQDAFPEKAVMEDHEILVKVRLPDCLNIDLLDLPGLVAVNPTYTSQNVRKVTEDLAKEVIEASKDFSIFILVNDVRLPANQSKGCEIIQRCKVQDRTLGIFTKIDLFRSEHGDDEEDVREIIECKPESSFHVGLGWMATSNRIHIDKSVKNNPQRNSENVTESDLQAFHDIDINESRLIQDIFPQLSVLQVAGIYHIRQRLQTVYDTFIANEWVNQILHKINMELEDQQKRCIELGMPIANDPRYLPYLVDDQAFTVKVEDVQNLMVTRLSTGIADSDGWITTALEQTDGFWKKIDDFSKFLHEPLNFKRRTYRKSQDYDLDENLIDWIIEPRRANQMMERIARRVQVYLDDIVQFLLTVTKTNVIDRLFNIISMDVELNPTVTKLARFPQLLEHFQRVVDTHCRRDEFKAWADEFIADVMKKPMTTGMYNMFKLGHESKEGKVWCNIYWSYMQAMSGYPNIILNKWYQFIYESLDAIQNNVMVEENHLVLESCFQERLSTLQMIHQLQHVYSEVDAFGKRCKSVKID